MRKTHFLILLLAVFATAQVAGQKTGSEPVFINNSAHRHLKGARTDTDTEERLKLPGLSKLRSLFKKSPKAIKSLEKNPALAKPLQDPKFGKTYSALTSDPSVVKSMNTLKNTPGVKADLLKSSTITEETVQKAGALVEKTAGKKWTKRDRHTLMVGGSLLLLFLLGSVPIIFVAKK